MQCDGHFMAVPRWRCRNVNPGHGAIQRRTGMIAGAGFAEVAGSARPTTH
jgi:hypothetical protein